MSDTWLHNWRSVNCWSDYHKQCTNERCRCACHEPKREGRR